MKERPPQRVRWIVPVQGALPWNGCTRARILQPSGNASHQVQRGELARNGNGVSCIYPDKGCLVWTHSSIRDLWEFLRLRVKKGHAAMGPMKLAFELRKRESADEWTDTEGTYPGLQPLSKKTTGNGPLSCVDHLYLECDSTSATLLRDTLSLWTYWEDLPTTSDAYQSGSSSSRMLSNARLALVDSADQAVCIYPPAS